MIRVEIEETIERVGETVTRIRHVAEAHPYGPFKLIHPLIQRMARRERQRTVDAPKASLAAGRRSGLK